MLIDATGRRRGNGRCKFAVSQRPNITDSDQIHLVPFARIPLCLSLLQTIRLQLNRDIIGATERLRSHLDHSFGL